MRGLVLILSAGFIFSCGGAVETIQLGTSAFMTARAGYQGYNALKMAKAIRRAEPILKDYEGIKVVAQLNTEDEEIKRAFQDNMEWMIRESLKRIGNGYENKVVCRAACPSRTIVIQFTETGYGESLAQKLLAGEKLRGRLYFIDVSTSRVLQERPLEVAENYIALLKEINLAVGVNALKELEKRGDADNLKKAMDAFNEFNPIKEEYVEILKRRG